MVRRSCSFRKCQDVQEGFPVVLGHFFPSQLSRVLAHCPSNRSIKRCLHASSWWAIFSMVPCAENSRHPLHIVAEVREKQFHVFLGLRQCEAFDENRGKVHGRLCESLCSCREKEDSNCTSPVSSRDTLRFLSNGVPKMNLIRTGHSQNRPAKSSGCILHSNHVAGIVLGDRCS